MSSKTRDTLLIIGLVIVIIITGSLREFVFKNVNYQLGYLYELSLLEEGEDVFKKTDSKMQFLDNYSWNQLSVAKWVLTVIFTLIYLGLTLLMILVIFKKREYLLWTLLLFGGIVVISAVLFTGGYIFGGTAKGYALSRVFMGFVQSPTPLMLLIPAFLLIKNQDRLKE
jgi:magnesium-transporting ATPase (P-type)